MFTDEQTLALAPDVVLQVVEGEALLLKLGNETVFSLNDTGARIAQLIAEGQRVDAVVRILATEYGKARDNVEREVNDLVQMMLLKGLVVLDRTGGVE